MRPQSVMQKPGKNFISFMKKSNWNSVFAHTYWIATVSKL